LNRYIHSKNDFKHNDNKKEPWLFLKVRDSESGNISIDVGTEDAYENNQDFPCLVD
jgi:hypothetical protein